MRLSARSVLPLLAALSLAPASRATDPPLLQAPAGSDVARVVPDGVTILPNGRLLTPAGRRLFTTQDLWNLRLRPDGKVAVALTSHGITVYPQPDATRAPAAHAAGFVLAHKGLCPSGVFTRDGSRLILGSGDDGGIIVYDTHDWHDTDAVLGGAAGTAPAGPLRVREQAPLTAISADGNGVKDSYINDLALSPDERFVYGVDIANQRVVTFDLTAGAVVGSVPAGREPYALLLSPDGKRLYVANIGLFDYTLIPKPMAEAVAAGANVNGLSKPPFAFPSRESEQGVEAEGRHIAGLGSPYVPEAQSVWMYSLAAPGQPRLARQAKAGLLIHAPADGGKAVGGSAPNALLLHGGILYVSCANNDTVQALDAATLKLRRTIRLSPSPLVAKLRGVIPSGMAMNAKGDRLYVCESGLNAVAVIDPGSGKTLGHIPTGWFPVQAALSTDEKTLYVATQKGLGYGPRGSKNPRPETDERFGLDAMPGMIAAIPLPQGADEAARQMTAWTQAVLHDNGIEDAGAAAGAAAARPPSALPRVPAQAETGPIRYVVFITKENHTFDGIFGGLKGANGEPDYAEFGREGWIREKGRTERVTVMPNHLQLAEQFAISDNFYMEPQASGDGHRWLVGAYPSLWTTRVFYSGWQFRANDAAKGRLVSFGSNGSQIPEDYLENGSLWEHLTRGGISFRNYGEGFEFPEAYEGPLTNKAGMYEVANYPMPKVLYDHTCFAFPSFNTNIPDIARADWFIQDIENNYRKRGKPLPRFLNIALCNDHGTGPRPAQGYPYVCSYMADNDLALGRVVEYLTHQPEWKNMAIFVTQDDSGADDDHVDRHRSYVLAISPYARHGYVSHVHTSIMSIIKSIYLAFGLGPNNQFDALASDLGDMFGTTPDFTPYQHLPSDRRIFRPEETFDPSDPTFERRRREKPDVAMDDPAFEEKLHNDGEPQGGK